MVLYFKGLSQDERQVHFFCRKLRAPPLNKDQSDDTTFRSISISLDSIFTDIPHCGHFSTSVPIKALAKPHSFLSNNYFQADIQKRNKYIPVACPTATVQSGDDYPHNKLDLRLCPIGRTYIKEAILYVE
jgi:hypothetical protein